MTRGLSPRPSVCSTTSPAALRTLDVAMAPGELPGTGPRQHGLQINSVLGPYSVSLPALVYNSSPLSSLEPTSTVPAANVRNAS